MRKLVSRSLSRLRYFPFYPFPSCKVSAVVSHFVSPQRRCSRAVMANERAKNEPSEGYLEAKVAVKDTKRMLQYLSFYKYVELKKLEDVQGVLLRDWGVLGVLGRIYIAKEGLNGQITIPVEKIDAFRMNLKEAFPEQGYPFADVLINRGNTVEFETENKPFQKLRLRIRDHLVHDGLNEMPDMKNRGRDVSPQEWHNLLVDQEKLHKHVLLDCRNYYEHDIGKFEGAERIMVDVFKDTFPILDDMLQGKPKNTSLMIYCTGGIRCEKVGAYLHGKGFSDIKKLEGGIVNYVEYIKKKPETSSKFLGKLFSFDDRVVGNESLKVTEDVLSKCPYCSSPCDTHYNCANTMCGGLILQCSSCATKMRGACSSECLEVVDMFERMNPEERRSYAKQHSFKWKSKIPNALYRYGKFNKRMTPNTRTAKFSTQTAARQPHPLHETNNAVASSKLQDYALAHTSRSRYHDILVQLRKDTESLLFRPQMICDEQQGNALRFLIQMTRASNILEIGCFSGYSALCMVEALPKEGRLVTCDVDPQSMALAKKYFQNGGVSHRIEMHLMDGLELLEILRRRGTPPFDFIYVDANKKAYQRYYDTILAYDLLHPHGTLAFDNTLFKGRVLTPNSVEKTAKAMAKFNAYVDGDERTTQFLLPLWDGFTLIQHSRAEPGGGGGALGNSTVVIK